MALDNFRSFLFAAWVPTTSCPVLRVPSTQMTLRRHLRPKPARPTIPPILALVVRESKQSQLGGTKSFHASRNTRSDHRAAKNLYPRRDCLRKRPGHRDIDDRHNPNSLLSRGRIAVATRTLQALPGPPNLFRRLRIRNNSVPKLLRRRLPLQGNQELQSHAWWTLRWCRTFVVFKRENSH